MYFLNEKQLEIFFPRKKKKQKCSFLKKKTGKIFPIKKTNVFFWKQSKIFFSQNNHCFYCFHLCQNIFFNLFIFFNKIFFNF